MATNVETSPRLSPVITAGIVLGVGLGGFFDGILLHQILQWHHMLSSVRPLTSDANIDLNMVWDGLFDAFDWLVTVVGVALLWRVAKQGVQSSGKTLSGSILMGAGLFNLVEGVIDHQILGIHHVKPGTHQLAWDIGFLVLGALLILIGWILVRSDTKAKENYE